MATMSLRMRQWNIYLLEARGVNHTSRLANGTCNHMILELIWPKYAYLYVNAVRMSLSLIFTRIFMSGDESNGGYM